MCASPVSNGYQILVEVCVEEIEFSFWLSGKLKGDFVRLEGDEGEKGKGVEEVRIFEHPLRDAVCGKFECLGLEFGNSVWG